MPRVGDKWYVVRGDCLWNIAKSVYGNPYKWYDIADANGVSRKTALIYDGTYLVLPGITAGTSSGGSSTPKPAATSTPVEKQVKVQWWALDAGTTRQMFCTWTYSRENTEKYQIEWYYDTGQGGWRRGSGDDESVTIKQYQFSADESAKKVQLKIKPISKDKDQNGNKYWTDGEWITVEYDFSNNPPLTPEAPELELENGVLKCTLTNIDENINADSIEFAIYKDNTNKYKTGTALINSETRYCEFICELEPGGSYTVRCRGVRGEIYGNWTDYAGPVVTIPNNVEEIIALRPQVISEQASKQYGVFVEWTSVNNITQYEIQYTTNVEYFDISENVNSVTVDKDQGPKVLINDIELGHEYFFRVRAINESGYSAEWTPIKSVTLGTKPDKPTTWSNVSNCVIGEDLNLYWVHNSTDGSIESYATIHMSIVDSEHPEHLPTEKNIVVRNEKPEEDKNKTSVYTINTNDDEWSLLEEGFIIKWEVKTAGVAEEYSDFSVTREINVYKKPSIEIALKNQNGVEIQEIDSFPFYINITSSPQTQRPISYYVEVVANAKYDTVDSVGKSKVVNIGDKIYQRSYDPTDNPWNFMLEMTPGNIDLCNDIPYTINATVAMNSGLTATNSINFQAYWSDMFYDVFADVIFNKDTLECSIHPYCNEYDDSSGEPVAKLTENCLLSVYRREYDGTFTLIADNIENLNNTYVTDPHPSLDYARYRVVATNKDTGSISFGDIQAVKIGEPSVVIQWAEEWSRFDADDSGETGIEPTWSGSMVKIPYNVDTQESMKMDVSLVEYVGRKHPVAYYGTQLGETGVWNVEIPREDVDTIYALRRLQKWTGDVYVREPSGVGYWANITVSFGLKHKEVTVPVTFNVTRVEGGM